MSLQGDNRCRLLVPARSHSFIRTMLFHRCLSQCTRCGISRCQKRPATAGELSVHTKLRSNPSHDSAARSYRSIIDNTISNWSIRLAGYRVTGHDRQHGLQRNRRGLCQSKLVQCSLQWSPQALSTHRSTWFARGPVGSVKGSKAAFHIPRRQRVNRKLTVPGSDTPPSPMQLSFTDRSGQAVSTTLLNVTSSRGAAQSPWQRGRARR